MDGTDKDLLNVEKSYCISMAKNENKWGSILDQIHYNGFPSCDIFEAVNGSEYKNSNNIGILSVWEEYILKLAKKRNNHEHFTSWGGLGCYLSHCAIWTDAINKGYKKIAVFEDDVVFANDFENRLKLSIVNVPENYEILLMGANRLSSTPVNGVDGNNIVAINRFFFTHAYVITDHAMTVLLSRAFPVELQIDSFMSFMIQLNSLPTYDIAGLCSQVMHLSSIQTLCTDCPDIGADGKYQSSFNYFVKQYHNIIIIILTILIIFLIANKE